MEISIVAMFVALVVVAVSALLVKSKLSSPKAMEGIPGSLGLPVIGESLSFLSEFSSPAGIYNFIKTRQQRYGKVFKSFVLGRFTIFTTGRDAARTLLTGKDVSLNLFYTGQQVLGPTSLLQTNGEEHKRLRRLIGEPLSIDGLRKYFEFINKLAIQTLENWPGREVLVLEEASTFTLKVIGHIIMSLEPTGEEQEKFRSNFKVISSSFAALPFKVPGTAFHRGIQARDRMYDMLDDIIHRRREGKDFHDDFLESLIMKHTKGAHQEANNEKLTDKQMKDNVLTLLVAGHDTTTAALTWLMKFLGENPDILEQLREEHRQIRESGKGGENLSWSEVNNMPYTLKVINETLRRATILPWFSRKATQDFEIDGTWIYPFAVEDPEPAPKTEYNFHFAGYKIQKGWSLNLDVVSIHNNPEYFPQPEVFNPSRFDVSPPFIVLSFQLPRIRQRAAYVPRNQPRKAGDMHLHTSLGLQIQVDSSRERRLRSAYACEDAKEQVSSSRGGPVIDVNARVPESPAASLVDQ